MRESRSATYAGRVSIQQQVTDVATRARAAARVLALATRAEKDAALTAIADALTTHETVILAANAADVERAEAEGTSAGIVDRLTLDSNRIAAMADGLRALVALPDFRQMPAASLVTLGRFS